MMREPTHGVVIGKVLAVDDPEKLGRIRIQYPWLEATQTGWVPVASIMAGDGRGAFFMPEVDDEVLLAFERGDWDHPFVIGFVWNPVQRPPTTDPRERIIRSKNGHTIRLIDSTAQGGTKGAIVIEDAHGNVITLTNGVVTIHSEGHLALSAASMTIMNRPVRPIGGPI